MFHCFSLHHSFCIIFMLWKCFWEESMSPRSSFIPLNMFSQVRGKNWALFQKVSDWNDRQNKKKELTGDKSSLVYEARCLLWCWKIYCTVIRVYEIQMQWGQRNKPTQKIESNLNMKRWREETPRTLNYKHNSQVTCPQHRFSKLVRFVFFKVKKELFQIINIVKTFKGLL